MAWVHARRADDRGRGLHGPRSHVLQPRLVVAVAALLALCGGARGANDANTVVYYGTRSGTPGLYTLEPTSTTPNTPMLAVSLLYPRGIAVDTCNSGGQGSFTDGRIWYLEGSNEDSATRAVLSDFTGQTAMPWGTADASNDWSWHAGSGFHGRARYDYLNDDYIYFYHGQTPDATTNAWYRADEDGSSSPVLVHGSAQSGDHHMAVDGDWRNGRLYFVDVSAPWELKHMALDGSDVQVACATGVDSLPRDMVMDARNRRVFIGYVDKVEALPLDTCTPFTVDTLTDGQGVAGMGYEHSSSMLYYSWWDGASNRYIDRAEINAASAESPVRQLHLTTGMEIGLAVSACVFPAHGPTCTEFSYTDGTQNGDETDVDCGGSHQCAPPCAAGEGCDVDYDCPDGISCSAGVCTPPAPVQPTVAFSALASAGECGEGSVGVLQVDGASGKYGATSADDDALLHILSLTSVTPDNGQSLPFVVQASKELRLSKVVDVGTYDFDLVTVEGATGLSTTTAMRGVVTCEGTLPNGNPPSATVQADLKGFTTAQFDAGDADALANVAALEDAVARGLGVDASAVSYESVSASTGGATATIELEASGSVPAEKKALSVALDTATVASQASVEVRSLAFRHLARTMSRGLGVCCNAVAGLACANDGDCGGATPTCGSVTAGICGA